MQATFEQLQANYLRACEGASTQHPRQIAARFATLVAEQIGLVNAQGQQHTRPDGFPCLAKDRKKTCADFNLHVLTEALLGPRWAQHLGLDTQGKSFPFRRLLSEEIAAPIGPSFFANFSAWVATAGALIQAQTLEGYETAEFDVRDLFPVRPVVFWQGGERYIAIIGPAEMADEVGPGESHPDLRMDGMWVEAGPLKKYGFKLTITKETGYVDITGGRIMAAAKEGGQTLAFRENDLTLNAVTGVTNNFKLGLTADASATGYNTFGATVPTGLGTTGTLSNDIVNPMVDPFTTFQASQDQIVQYKHPVTGIPMSMANRLSTALIPTSLSWLAMFMRGVGQLQVGTQGAAPLPTIATSTFPTMWMISQNPFTGTITQVRESLWLQRKHMDSATPARPTIPAGQGLSLANARRWYRLDPERFACRRAAWEMAVVDLSPNDFVMADQGIIAGQVGNIAVMVQVLNPWAIQRNKVS